MVKLLRSEGGNAAIGWYRDSSHFAEVVSNDRVIPCMEWLTWLRSYSAQTLRVEATDQFRI